jgi:hypothetical protein
VVVVARAIEVGGHQADRIKAVLLAQGFAELDAGDLGDGVPRPAMPRWPATKIRSAGVIRDAISPSLLLGPEAD